MEAFALDKTYLNNKKGSLIKATFFSIEDFGPVYQPNPIGKKRWFFLKLISVFIMFTLFF